MSITSRVLRDLLQHCRMRLSIDCSDIAQNELFLENALFMHCLCGSAVSFAAVHISANTVKLLDLFLQSKSLKVRLYSQTFA